MSSVDYKCLDNSESKSYKLTDNGGSITFKGWNHPNPEKMIREELEDEYYEEYEVTELVIESKEEGGYTSSRYYEGQDAKDEGFSCWLDFQKYRKGLGKCTHYQIRYKLIERSK